MPAQKRMLQQLGDPEPTFVRIVHTGLGQSPHCRGTLDENGRLLVIINRNTDLSDAWEWADLRGYPAKLSTCSCKIGINTVVYAMSHRGLV